MFFQFLKYIDYSRNSNDSICNGDSKYILGEINAQQ